MSCDQPSDHRPDDGGAAERAGNIALHSGASFAAIDVSDHGLRDRNQRAGADALHDAKRDQRNHIPRQSAQCGADKKDAYPEQQHRLSAIEVGQPPINRNQDRLRQQVSAENPAEEIDATQRADNCRHGGGDNRSLDGCHEDCRQRSYEYHRAIQLRPSGFLAIFRRGRRNCLRTDIGVCRNIH